MAERSKYQRDFERLIHDPGLWPGFSIPNFLNRLDAIANKAICRGSVEGNIAAILIHQQLVEEVLRLLLRDCDLLVRLALFPIRVPALGRDLRYFGHWQRAVACAIEFPHKKQLLRIAERINGARNDIAHDLVKGGSLSGLRRRAISVKRNYNRLFVLFESAHDNFRVSFNAFRKNWMS